jgi:nucleoside-diphosphate-sugar epimerase
MRLLILGASGYLGSHIRTCATGAGIDVVTAGRSPVPDSPHHECLDIAAGSASRISAVISQTTPDAIVNCAGAMAGSPDVLAATNISGTYHLIEAMLAARKPPRLIHLGSAAEYGSAGSDGAVTEDAVPRPLAAYGTTKLGATRLVQLASMAGLSAIVLRVFNPVGPGAPRSTLPGNVTARLKSALNDGGDIRLGPLDAVRDFVDVRDVAEAVVLAATRRFLPHRVINVGSGRPVLTRALVSHLTVISGYTGIIKEDDQGSNRSTGVLWQQADITRAVKDLGWTPRRDLITSLTDMWEAIP